MERIRYDRGIISLSGRKPVRTDDGTLLLDAVFARDGVLDYKIMNGTNMGIRRELRPPEENKKAIAQFGIIPVTDEHPPGLLDSSNSSLYRKGITLQNPRYETIAGKGGFVLGQIAIFDSELQERILSGEQIETSSGYKCACEEKPGRFKHLDGSFYDYDAIQRNLEVNHQAITRKGRAGADVCVYLDSIHLDDEVGVSVDAFHFDVFDTALKPIHFDMGGKRMASIHLDGATYDVTEAVAAAISAHLHRHDTVMRDLEEAHDSLSSVMGERDALEFRLENAERKLDSVGFVSDGEGDYRLDMAKAKAKMAELDDEEDESDEEDDGDYEEEEPLMKGKRANKDSAIEFIAALRHADSLFGELDEEGNTFSSLHGEYLDSASDVRRLSLQAMYPSINMDAYDDEQIDAMYDVALQEADGYDDEDAGEEEYEESENTDSDSPDYATPLAELIGSARINTVNTVDQGVDAAWKEPLAMSR